LIVININIKIFFLLIFKHYFYLNQLQIVLGRYWGVARKPRVCGCSEERSHPLQVYEYFLPRIDQEDKHTRRGFQADGEHCCSSDGNVGVRGGQSRHFPDERSFREEGPGGSDQYHLCIGQSGWTPSRVDRGTAQGSGGSPAKCLFQPELATSPGLKVEVSP